MVEFIETTTFSVAVITFGTASIAHDSHNIICTGVSNKKKYAAVKALGVNPETEPILTLCFMVLPGIPELKITDIGLFNVTKFEFT